MAEKQLILAVDDEAGNLQLLHQILGDDYRLLLAKDGERALALARDKRPALILLDVVMPGLGGYEICERLKADPATAAIPVVFVTSMGDTDDELRGFRCGAVDYISKPVSPPIVQARVRTHLSLVRAEELLTSRLEFMQRLGRAAEYKDNETGTHVLRMSHYARLLALAAGLGEEVADELLHAAPLHDVGKIGIPDHILLKPGKLDADEWKIMQTHAAIGADIIGEHPSGMLRLAHRVALEHHEKYDGSGYPNGLVGEQIDITARIVAIADVFDALTSSRPYKQAWPLEQVIAYLLEQRGKHFDPHLVELFMDLLPEVDLIRRRWQDTH
ncbi:MULTISPECIES: two-component system response regulator [unclassified Duganella]|uniref:response regulator n=1 Tax=unclassified Duganella TaxID=2636909 RepID=UPI000E34F5C9|nr:MULTISPECIES: HD domain-containing phosphohydrolase [unclassified Duganella]RFP18728.1 response regulator [Duganella sp. BJB475]RFP35393.1 response regulator [Duganella sp. BJB476]